MHLEGATQIIAEPEFQDPVNLRLLVRILDHPDELGAVLREQPSRPGTTITIGVGAPEETLPFSLVSARVSLRGREGRIGILGPMRMHYALALALVGRVAEVLGGSEDRSQQAH
jgi:transcriptional regulator of heat shock response